MKQAVLVIGSANADILVRVAHAPGPGETVLGAGAQVQPGGKGANQAVAAARAGATVVFGGALGRDTFAEVPREALKRAGIDLRYLQDLNEATGLALINVAQGGENSITVASGANAHYGPALLPPAACWQQAAQVLLQQEIPLETVVAAAQAARGAGAGVILNAAPFRELPDELWPLLDVLVVNEHELSQLAQQPEGQEEAAARSLLARGAGAVIVTLGGRGALLISQAGPVLQAAYPVAVSDTTGAGDTFCGVLAAWLAEGHTLPEALKAASVAGALACTQLGAQAAMPSRYAIEAALESGFEAS